MILDILTILCCSIYIARVLVIKTASQFHRNKYSKIDNYTNFPFVSVIIPAKDEEDNIQNCLNSVLNSNFPAECFEVIVINDRSTDRTFEIVNNVLNSSNITIKLCNITEEHQNPNLRGKPGAIKHGIDIAKGEILMLTDADCIVDKNWIRQIAKHFVDGKDKNIGMICAYTNVKTSNIFHYFQAAEWTYMHTYACAGIGMSTPLGCFGNNISISKTAYNHIGGFDKLKFSVTEDYVLLKSIFEAGFSVRYLCSKDTTVETLPVETFRRYLRQRKRWAVGGLDLKWKAFAYALSSICLWVAIIISIFAGNWYLLSLSCLLRFVGDFMILFPIFNILETRHIKKWVPLSVCFYSITEFIIPFMLLNRTVYWKGQKFNSNT